MTPLQISTAFTEPSSARYRASTTLSVGPGDADVDVRASNRIMWVKSGLLLALAANGVLTLRNEEAVRRSPELRSTFSALRTCALTSVILWLAIVLAGVELLQR